MKRSHLVVLAGLLAAGAYGYARMQAKPVASGSAESSRGRFSIPANAAAFRFGTLDFSACELARKHSAATTEAWCAPFKVAENRALTGGRTLDLKLALIKSSQAADDDFIVFLAGGPGQSAIESWPQIAAALAPARKHRHVLLLDQRGTGASNALQCAAMAEQDETLDFDIVRIESATRTCLAEVGKHADPRYYTTTDAVEDLEALRQALGAPKFDLVGVSYGTRVAQQYLKRHPEGVRSLVLDSVAPNELALGGEFARNLDEALKAQFAYCAKNPACAKAFPDPYANLIRLRDSLRETPRQVSFPDPVDFTTHNKRLDAYALAGLVRMFAYAPETAALIPQAVAQSLAGNDAPLMGQLGILNQGIEELAGSGMQLSVICAEDADRLSADPAADQTLLGNLMVEVVKAQCAIWPQGSRPADFNEPGKSDTPILVLSGELDPVTPPRYGEQVVATLANARLIVARGQGHNVIGRGCLPKLVGEFLDTRAPKALDTRCVDELGPIPHFIDFNGAAP
ncbi:MAG TPA: alpha/beta hydrolase [Dokdonella sp.]|uniref:alpha/beta hydrolase n=1 Tax=Dokdonella sp. TaxID=2291710 RepID=UPI002C9A4AE3|nr:alpha/beta hydrolase [Dokdonella sp.]HOX71672.1 alpha/beta hydrolase [Dokdonella sp.]HPG95439.1 alpha/beta hydrolase [Dokdonella sp.]HPN78202.1 alpha/beta hydrolase [Dokdonella sp.]